MRKGILAKIRPEPPIASLAPKGLEPKPEPLPPLKVTSRRERGEIGDVRCSGQQRPLTLEAAE
jgi:hypothetical protein